MDEFEITLEELEQLCTELGLEITKYNSNSFTNVYVRLPESEMFQPANIIPPLLNFSLHLWAVIREAII